MLKNVNFTLNKPIRGPNYAKLRRNQCSGIVPPLSPPLFVPPLLPPLSFSSSQGRKYGFFRFFDEIPNVHAHLGTSCPPFAPPFHIFGKFMKFPTNFIFIIFPQNVLVWLYNPKINKKITPFTMTVCND